MKAYEKTTLNGSGQVCSQACVLRYIVVSQTANGTIVIGDNAVGDTSNPVGTLAANVPRGTYMYDCAMTNGIFITMGGASFITVIYELI